MFFISIKPTKKNLKIFFSIIMFVFLLSLICVLTALWIRKEARQENMKRLLPDQEELKKVQEITKENTELLYSEYIQKHFSIDKKHYLMVAPYLTAQILSIGDFLFFEVNNKLSDKNFEFLVYILNNDLKNEPLLRVFKIYCIKLILSQPLDFIKYEKILFRLRPKTDDPYLDKLNRVIHESFDKMRMKEMQMVFTEINK